MKYSDNQMLLEYVKGRVIFCFYIFEDKWVVCQTGDDAFFMTCAGSVTSTSDVSGKKLKVLVTAYIDGKEVNQLVKEYETKGEILIENFSVSTTAK